MTANEVCKKLQDNGYPAQMSTNGSHAMLRTVNSYFVFTIVTHEGNECVEVERSINRLRYAWFPVAEADCLDRVLGFVKRKG
jgi:predicted RNA binding protein YcfA (HicA-like mRNA interferase family)